MRSATRWIALAAVAMMLSTTTAVAQDSVDVTFRIDMTALIDSCQYSVARGDTIAVRGDFNDWSDQGVWTILEDTGEDNVYAATVSVEPGVEFQYKFWTNRAPWEDGDNRRYTPTTDAEQVLPIAQYNKHFANICAAEFEDLEIIFSVNMETMIRSGEFDPDTDLVTVAGSFNGWNTTADTLEADFLDPNIFSKTVFANNVTVPSTIEFKFVRGTEGGNIDGWEGVPNRTLAVTGFEDRTPEDRLFLQNEPIPYFNDATPDLLFSQNTTLTLRVDARPAFYFLADSGFVPSDVQTSEEVADFSTIFINGPISNVDGFGDWYTWGPNDLGQLEARGFEASAENDSIFVWTRTFNQDQIRRWVGKMGLDGYDNENGFGADHVFVIPDESEVTIDLIFGAVMDGGNVRSDLYGAYIGQDAEGNPYVRRNPGVVSIEPIGTELPSTIALDQNYPNPFNPTTTFEYRIDAMQHVTLKVYDMLGREVATLVDGVQAPSNYRVSFEANNLPSGTYMYQLRAGSQVITRTMTLLK
jgi:hypothetical protein